MKTVLWLRAGAALGTTAFASMASAQTASLYNGGFETLCLFGCGCSGPFSEGWHSPGCDNIVKRRFVGDGLTPAFSPVGTVGAITPNTGNAVTEIGTRGSGGFEGIHTDTINFCYCDQTCGTACAPPFPFFDPFFDYSGGDVVVTGFYMIPASSPITGDVSGIKIEVKVGNQNVAQIEDLSISGHTNGQWMPYSLTFPRSEIQRQYDCNRGILPMCGCSCVPMTPEPNHTKVTIMRFAGDGTPTSGVVYWDDVTYTQLPGGPSCDSIDFNNDGLFPDTLDIDDFLSVFSGGACSNDPNCGDIDFNNDGLFPDTLDVDSLLSVFSGGGCL
jgi:hypothetical protein